MPWTLNEIVTSSAEADCGPLTVEFFNKDISSSPLDETIFFDDRTNSPSNQLTITQAVDGDFRYGRYDILYRVYYIDHPAVRADQNYPFIIRIEDPCGDETVNSLTAPPFVNQEYSVATDQLIYTVPSFT